VFSTDLLKNRGILITGGGTGLGFAMAQRFAALGGRIAICGRRQAVLDDAVALLRSQGAEATGIACDVRDPEQVDAMVEQAETALGRIDVLVNNAAGNFISPTERLSHRAVDAVVGIVLHGTLYCTLAVGKRWIAAGQGGVMLNIVTSYAWTGSAYVVPSAVAKAGVLALTRSLAVEWARYGIRQVAIAPGPFPTEGAWSRLLPTDELRATLTQRVPLGRVGDVSELANLAAFVISDGAGYINGEVIAIDGGEWLQGAGEFNGLLDLTEQQWDAIAAAAKKR